MHAHNTELFARRPLVSYYKLHNAISMEAKLGSRVYFCEVQRVFPFRAISFSLWFRLAGRCRGRAAGFLPVGHSADDAKEQPLPSCWRGESACPLARANNLQPVVLQIYQDMELPNFAFTGKLLHKFKSLIRDFLPIYDTLCARFYESFTIFWVNWSPGSLFPESSFVIFGVDNVH
jgi:hypothetical protein